MSEIAYEYAVKPFLDLIAKEHEETVTAAEELAPRLERLKRAIPILQRIVECLRALDEPGREAYTRSLGNGLHTRLHGRGSLEVRESLRGFLEDLGDWDAGGDCTSLLTNLAEAAGRDYPQAWP